MTLDEAIRHCEEVANDKAGCCENCANEHRQFAEWLKQVPRWISVADRLPEDSGEYMVYIVANNEPKNKSIITLYYTNLTKRFIYGSDNLFTITHWRYLPEPPESEE